MPVMNGGEALIRSLRANGVEVVFGLPGAGQYEAIDAIYRQEGMRYITTRNEQAISYMADGYARVSGKPGVGIAVEGPGFFNTTAGLATAFAQSSPVLLVTGDHHGVSIPGRPPHDSRGDYGAYSKWSGRAESPGDIPGLVREALLQLNTPRKRPIVLEIGPHVFRAEEEVRLLETASYAPAAGDAGQLAHAARLLAESKRPLIWVGAGASDGAPLVRKIAEHLGSPVVSSRSGKGILPARHPLSLGMFEARFKPLKDRVDECDVILSVGTATDLSARLGGQTVIRIDDDPDEINQDGSQTHGIQGDAALSLEVLYGNLAGLSAPRPNVTEDIQAINAHRFGPAEQLQPQGAFMDAMRAAIPDDGIFVGGMNQMGYYGRNYYHSQSPRGYQTSSHHGTLGSVFPVGIGLKIGRPDRAVVVVSGDGGILYNLQELATAVQYGINVVTVVFNDNAYGNVWRAQMEEFDGRVIGTELHNPDFVRLAEAYGSRGVLAEDASQLEAAVGEAVTADAPTLIEVPVGPWERRY
ncbi:MAG: thiamine pyrophosphate-binding protein [Gemmatimonadetes bacterium]|nr:thiamine pyrophosphate-binding protein [Gemmatimonadota bacterium]